MKSKLKLVDILAKAVMNPQIIPYISAGFATFGRKIAKAKIKSESVKVKEDFVSDYYNSKGVFYMQMHGKGSMFLGSDPFSIAKELGMAKFEGEFVLKSRVFASSYKGKDGKTAGYTYKVIAEPKVSPKTIKN